MTPPEYEYLRKVLRDNSGLDLSADKQYLVESRLLPLSRKAGLSGTGEIVEKLKGGSASLTTQVVEAMTTNETFFFRDKIPFDHFRLSIIPEILRARAGRNSIRIWCAAASTGQEPYSLAICLKEMGSALAGWRVEIIATDLSQEVLEKSRAACRFKRWSSTSPNGETYGRSMPTSVRWFSTATSTCCMSSPSSAASTSSCVATF
jgi:chemotaxis protein methyltransferase CheR